jgi:hypothetical protein
MRDLQWTRVATPSLVRQTDQFVFVNQLSNAGLDRYLFHDYYWDAVTCEFFRLTTSDKESNWERAFVATKRVIV